MKNGLKKKFQEIVNRNEKGFTTIELIIVIVIAGIMAAVAIPKMNHISEVDLYTTARQVKSDIRYAQQLAMSKYMTVKITFNGGTDTYDFADKAGNGIGIPQKSLPSGSRALFNVTRSFDFDSSGDPTPTPSASWEVGISTGGRTAVVRVSDITGRATIQ